MKQTTFLLKENERTTSGTKNHPKLEPARKTRDIAPRAACHNQQLMSDLGTRACSYNCGVRAGGDAVVRKGESLNLAASHC